MALLPGFNFNLFSSSYPEQERWGGYATFTDKICGDEVQIFGDFYYDDVKQHDELAPIATGSFRHDRTANPGHSASQQLEWSSASKHTEVCRSAGR